MILVTKSLPGGSGLETPDGTTDESSGRDPRNGALGPTGAPPRLSDGPRDRNPAPEHRLAAPEHRLAVPEHWVAVGVAVANERNRHRTSG